MAEFFIDNLFCDGYYFFIRGWILHRGVPSWKFSKKIVLYSNTNNIQILPDVDLRPDVTQAYNDPSGNKSDFINYDHSGFVLKILKQNIPNDYFNVRVEIRSEDIFDEAVLGQKIYI